MQTSIDKLTAPDPGVYTATASVKDGLLDTGSTTVTGDRSTGLFTDATGELGKDDFLLLLVTQLRMQDPLSPMQNTELVTQMAQLRSIETSNNLEQSIKGLEDSFKGTVDAQKYSAMSVSNSSAVSLIGKEVRLRQTAVRYGAAPGETEQLQIHLGNSSSAEVQLLDADGKVVRTLQAGNKDSENSAVVTWDGSTDEGGRAPAGTYTVRVVGQETDGSLYAFVQDTVDGVRFSSDGALIKVGGQELSIGNVMDVSAGGSATATLSPTSAISLLGKQVRMRDDSAYYGARDGESVHFSVNAGMHGQVTVRIKDAAGDTVRILQVPAVDGVAEVNWDGRGMDAATPVAAGTYRIDIDEAANDTSVYAYSEGVVDGISNGASGTHLRIGGRLVSPADIIDIATPAQAG